MPPGRGPDGALTRTGVTDRSENNIRGFKLKKLTKNLGLSAILLVLSMASFSAFAGQFVDHNHYMFANGTIATVTYNSDGSISGMYW